MAKGYVHIILTTLVMLTIFAAAAGVLIWRKNTQIPDFGFKKACTLEAMVCPNGSSVGRSGPNCEFAACPITMPSLSDNIPTEMANWKTYTNGNMGFTISYPPDLSIEESNDQVTIGKTIVVHILGDNDKDKYFGCAIPVDRCPKGTSMEINGIQVFKNEGKGDSVGGKDLLEYQFLGKYQNSLYFEFHGDINNQTMVTMFNSMAQSLHYKNGQVPGPRG